MAFINSTKISYVIPKWFSLVIYFVQLWSSLKLFTEHNFINFSRYKKLETSIWIDRLDDTGTSSSQSFLSYLFDLFLNTLNFLTYISLNDSLPINNLTITGL